MTTKYYDKNDQKFDKFVWKNKNGKEESVTTSISGGVIYIRDDSMDAIEFYSKDIPKLIWALKEVAKELNINIEEE